MLFKYRSQYFVLFILLSFSCYSLGAISAKTAQEKVIFFSMDLYPYGYFDEEGQPTGLLFEVLNKILEEAQIDNKNRIMPVKRLQSMMDEKVKICTIMADTPEQSESLVKLVSTEISAKAGFLPRKNIDIRDYSALKNITIAVPYGIIFDTRLENDNTLSIIKPPGYLHAMKMLKLKRVDAVGGSIPVLKVLAQNIGMTGDELGTPLIFTQNKMHVYCTNTVDDKVLNLLKKTVIRLHEEGVFEKIMNRYVHPDISQ